MRKVLFAFAVLAVAVGCSSSEDGTTTVSADQACTDFASTLCDKVQTCTGGLWVQSVYGDLANCQSRAKAECMQGLSAPNTAAMPSDVASCSSAAKSVQCTALFSNDLPAVCAPKSGGLADGAPCGTDSQCKSAFCAFNDDKEVCGVCAVKPTEGGAAVRGKCPLGLVASQDDSTCVKPTAVGGACDPKKACATGSSCFGGKCVADLGTEGAVCNEKDGPVCDGMKGLGCLGGKCIKITLAAAGAECGVKIEGTGTTAKITGLVACEKGGWCKGLDAAAGKFTGTCEAAAADGAACIADADFQKGPGCIEPAECVNGKCTLPDAATCK